MNARSETVGELRSFARAWRQQQLCLVPAISFDEPCYETGKAEWWSIAMADKAMFAVAGLWSEWAGENGPETSFTQLTINTDEHALMRHFHKPGDEKRMLVGSRAKSGVVGWIVRIPRWHEAFCGTIQPGQ
jgi:putative SOS response-associated peptidase YedK